MHKFYLCMLDILHWAAWQTDSTRTMGKSWSQRTKEIGILPHPDKQQARNISRQSRSTHGLRDLDPSYQNRGEALTLYQPGN